MGTKEFWDQLFKDIDLMWGKEPAASAHYALQIFKEEKRNKILIPGFGYGRNGKLFYDNGFDITGIEIAPYAIELAHNAFQLPITIYCGSVNDMPFDEEEYDGIYCHALVHLLNKKERNQFMHHCLHQMKPGGLMLFSIISTESSLFGQGKRISNNRYALPNGVTVYFYSVESAADEFKKYGQTEVFELDEPIAFKNNEPPLKMLMVKIRKSA